MEGAKKNPTLSAARCFLVLAVYLAALTAAAADGPAAGFALCAPNNQDQRRADMCSMRALPARAGLSKVLHLVRHGQAAHNVRAEPARHAGCSYDEFLELMRLDDAFDAGLQLPLSICMNIYMHVHTIYTRTRTHTPTHTYTNKPKHRHTWMCVYVCVYTQHMHVYIYIHIYIHGCAEN